MQRATKPDVKVSYVLFLTVIMVTSLERYEALLNISVRMQFTN